MTDTTRSIQLEVEITGTPEEAWSALSTSEGLANWFPLEATVEPGEGGTVWLSWGPGCEGKAPIHIWEPLTRFGWTESYGDDAEGRPIRVAVDFHIEGRGGSTVVRLVQSGLSASSDWDDMYDALVDGWTYFLFNLRHWFTHHRGEVRSLAWQRAPTELDRPSAWAVLKEAGLVSDATAGQRTELAIGSGETALVASTRPGHHFTATLPDLDDSILFVEFEGRHIGFWLSTYGMTDADVNELQSSLDRRIRGALGSRVESD